MPTTGNQNQDNNMSEEAVLRRNDIDLETPATEMASTERSEIISHEDTSTLEASDTGDGAVGCSVNESEVTVQDDGGTPLYSQPDVSDNASEVQQQYLQEGASFSSAITSQSEIDKESCNAVSDTGIEVSSVETDPSSLEFQEAHPDSSELNHQGLHPSDDPAEQEMMTEVLHSTHGEEMMDVDPSESAQPTQEMASAEHIDSIHSEADTGEGVQLFQDDGAVEANPASEVVASPSSMTLQSTHDQVTFSQSAISTELEAVAPEVSDVPLEADHEIPSDSVMEQTTSEANEERDNITSEYLDGAVECSSSNQEPEEMAGTAQFFTPNSSDSPCDGADHKSESPPREVPNNDTSVDFDMEKQATTENVSEELQQEEGVPVVAPPANSQEVPNSETNEINDAERAGEVSNTGTECESDNLGTGVTGNETVTPSGTALMTDIFDDDFSPPQQAASVESNLKQTTAASQLSSNSFQSAFAAFASAVPPTNSTPQQKTQPPSGEVVEESATPQAVDSVADSTITTVAQEPKKISRLPMPGEIQENVNAPEPTTNQEMVQSNTMTEQTLQNQAMEPESATEMPSESTGASDAVYFIQMADAAGEVVTSIIDPNDIASYADSVVYKQCMGADGQIETTIVNSGGMMYQEEQQQPQAETAPEPQQEMEQQVIYAHDLNGQLTPIDSSQSANDVAPPGKQFVYMQDSSGRIIRTIMDANQTMVPGQQVYYTQSDDGRIITSVMDSESTDQTGAASAECQQPQQQGHDSTQVEQEAQQQREQVVGDGAATQQHGSAPGFAIDNSGLSGLSMLAELTAGQAPVDLKGSSSAENSCQDADMEEFRPVAMITRRLGEEGGVEAVNSDMATLKMAQGTQSGDTPSESMLAKLTTEITGGSTLPLSVSRDNLFVQWQNLDAMCWMDVVLIMLVYSPSLQPLVNMEPSHELASTLLITLLKANRQAQVLLQNLLKRSEANNIQNGSGITTTAVKDAKTSRLVCKENMDEIGKAINILYAMREQIWQALQPRLQCERGKHNSPVLVLPLLVREKPVIKQMFTMKFRYVFKCDKCGYSQDDTHSKILPTIPAVPPTFNMKEPCFVRNCFECKAPNQRMYMRFESLQDFVQMHFVKGLPHNRFDELSFDHNGDHYEVTAVVHYKNNPDHFIAWVRNAPENTWMECDDLKSVITRYQSIKPPIPPSQVHMVMWERRLTPQHVQVMRDTEDTRILSSLVLTVQQPGGGQQDAATKQASTLGSATGLAQGTASSVLSGLINQSQSTSVNFSPYTSRGRGSRGGNRGRGRGRGSSVTTLRRGANNQLITPSLCGTPTTTRPAGSPQIIRLPLSALQGMGAQLRGATPGASPSSQRIVLMGANSSASQTTTSTSAIPQQKKVVVLRSQDGSTSLNQLSATQLLQLLQRSGAISSANTRITTTISKASSDGSTQQQTITLTPSSTLETASAASGQIVATPVTTTGQTENIETTPQAQVESVVQTPTDSRSDALGEAPPVSAADAPMDIDPAATSGQTQTSATTAVSQTEDAESFRQSASGVGYTSEPSSTVSASASSSISVLSTPAISTSEMTTDPQSRSSVLALNSGTIRALTRTGASEGNRYVQIPNPKGGPNIMTRLILRGDKMMLVPVEKSSESTVPVASTITTVASSSPSSSNVRAPSSLLSAALQSSTLVAPSLPTTTISTGSSPTARYITIPGNQGAVGKRTIQLISVPKGSTAAGVTSAGSNTRTLILGQSTSAGTTATRLISQSQVGGDVIASASQQLQLQQQASGNVIVRDGNSVSGEISTQTPLHGSTVSLLRDVAGAKSTSTLEDRSQGISILSSASGQASTRTQESFRYILPGSNSQQMASIQSMSGGQLGNKAFTALSSSGTIIGGQLTTVNTPDMTPSPVDSVDAGVQSLYPELDAISPTVITSRGRGRGGRGNRGGRGRGSLKTRGGRQNQIIIGQQQQIQLSGQHGGTVSMLPADFHGIGGQIIQTSTESVDGAPVVSIPDFSNTAISMQSEPQQVVPESGLITTANTVDPLCPPPTESVSLSSPLHQQSPMSNQEGLTSPESDANQGPRVITQTIPSIKANHGFDILTQGILGNAQTPPPARKTGISLLTGKTVTSPPLISSSPTSSSSSSLFTSDVTRMQQTLAMGHSVSQNEIETLIKAAQGAAKPPKPGQIVDETSDIVPEPAENGKDNQMETEESKTTALTQDQTGFNLDDFLTGVKSDDSILHENVESREEEKCGDDKQEAMDTSESGGKRVFSIDESQVSAAERYRMPTELFQPDEESPEKPVRSDSISRHISGSNILEEDLPSKLFSDPEISSQEDEMKSPTPQVSHQLPEKSPEKEMLPSPVIMKSPSVVTEELEAEENNVQLDEVNQVVNASPSVGLEDKVVDGGGDALENLKVSSPKGKNKKSGSRKKRRSSSKHSFSENEDTVSGAINSPPSSPNKMVVSSPVKVREDAILSEGEKEVPVGGFASDILSESVWKEEQNVPTVEPSYDEVEESLCKAEQEEVTESKVDISSENVGCVRDSFDEKQDVIDEKQDMIDIKSDMIVEKQDIIVEKHSGKENAPPASARKRKPRKRVASLPKALVVNKKQKADWSSEETRKSSKVFCYSLLSRTRNRKSSRRHASLGFAVLSYTSAPTQYLSPRKKEDPHELLTCVVKRRHARALERPKVDPSKEPTVIPLVPEEDADPACTFGGSVVTIPEKGEVFTGVVVRKSREIADWNSGVFDEESDSFVNDKWEDKESLREYLETMWTSMCMELSFSDFFDKCDYDGGAYSCDEEEVDEEDESDISFQSMDEDREEGSAIMTDEGKCEDTISSVNDGNFETIMLPNIQGEKHKMNDDVETDNKRIRLSDDENISCGTIGDPVAQTMSDFVHKENNDSITPADTRENPGVSSTTLPLETVSNVANKISTISSSPSKTPITSTSCFNGFSKSESVVSTLPFANLVTSSSTKSLSTVLSVTSSSSSPAAATATVSSPLPSKKHSKPSTSSTPAFVSPTRRSSRTPVPSLKVRDSLEDGSGGGLAMKVLSKNRRSSVLSSDDDMSGSGYSSDDVAIKKKTKKFHLMS